MTCEYTDIDDIELRKIVSLLVIHGKITFNNRKSRGLFEFFLKPCQFQMSITSFHVFIFKSI